MTNVITLYVYKDGKHLSNLDRRSHWSKAGATDMLNQYLEELATGAHDWVAKTIRNSDGTCIKAKYGDVVIKTVFDYET